MAVKDSEEATQYTVVLQDITQLYGYSYGELNMLQCMRELIQCKWTLNQHSDDQGQDRYLVALKKQLGIFHDVFHIIIIILCFFITAKLRPQQYSTELPVLLQHVISMKLITCTADYG